MKFGSLYFIIQRIIKLKDTKMDLKSTYSLLQLQNAIVKNDMFVELDKKQNQMRIDFLQDSKDADEETKQKLADKLNAELSELSELEIEGLPLLSLRLVVDPNEKMILSLDDINFFNNVLGDEFVLIDKSNDMQIVL